MNELVCDIMVYDKDRRRGFSIDFVKTGQTIKPNGKKVGHYKAIVDVLYEGDVRI